MQAKSLMKASLSALAITMFLASPGATLAEEAAPAPQMLKPPPVQHYESNREAVTGRIDQSRQNWQNQATLSQDDLEKRRELAQRSRELYTDTTFAATQNDQLNWQNVMLQRQQDYLNQMQNDHQLATAMLQNRQQADQIRLQYQQQARQNALANQQAALQNAIQRRQNNIGNWQQRRANNLMQNRQAMVNAMGTRRGYMQNNFQHRAAMQGYNIKSNPYLGPSGALPK